jgi:hypothetical protein
MKYINEVKSEDLPADQILGYVCELAVEDTVLNRGATIAVSYTHLTLPTKLL